MNDKHDAGSVDSSIAGPSSQPDTEPAQSLSRDDSYVSRHWRGELSLGLSYWVNGVLISIVSALFVVGIVDKSMDVPESGGDVAVRYIIFGALEILFVWQMVGIWRSAEHHPARGGTRFWAGVAKVMVFIAVLREIAELLKAVV